MMENRKFNVLMAAAPSNHPMGLSSAVRFRPHHPAIRLLAFSLAILLALTGSNTAFAITMGQIKAGVISGAGGQGSFSNLQNAGAASAALTAAMAQGNLKKANEIVGAMRQFQVDAKKNASGLLNGQPAPNGLKAGWLEPYVPGGGPGIVNGSAVTTSWSGAAIVPSQNSANAADPNYVNIQQSSQNAYLYWNHFNVGPKTTMNFDQSKGGGSAGNWIAFNKVMSSSDPSHIFGNISAQGQVYILNQNGILFHNGSTVNTHTLVASTLPINGNLVGDALTGIRGRGIANNPDYQFLFSAFPQSSSQLYGPTPAFTPPAPPEKGIGDILVESGAVITSPPDASHSGGLVALVAPNVRNDGTISTANGQTILAAGLQVGFSPHLSTDPSLRGMDVYVGNAIDSSINTISVGNGAVTTGKTGLSLNNGMINVPEGNATLAGAVVQTGPGSVIDSATSTGLNGRIDLLANYGAMVNDGNNNTPGYNSKGSPLLPGQTGLVDLGAGSALRILPDLSDQGTLSGSLALYSIVHLQGSTIHLGQDAVLEAPGAATTPGALNEAGGNLKCGVTLQAGNWEPYSVNISYVPKFDYTAGQVYLDQGSIIDLGGSVDVPVQSSQNYLTLQLRGNELANSPLQRGNTTIRGKNITVDARIGGTSDGKQYLFATPADAYAAYQAGKITWIGTPLGDVTGFVGLIQRSVSQLTELGGSLSIAAGDSIVMQPGSLLNVSGGWSHYTGGSFATTKLLQDGNLVDISKAMPNLEYQGVASISSPIVENSYLNGASGGAISIQAPSVALDGLLMGVTVAGMKQIRNSVNSSSLPASSSLTLHLLGQSQSGNPVSPYAPSVAFGNALSSMESVPSFSLDPSSDLGSALPISRQSSVTLSPDLLSVNGFGNVDVLSHDGTVSVPAGVTLDAGVGGSVVLEGANVIVDGKITAAGGSIAIKADQVGYRLAGALVPLTYSEPPTAVLVNGSGEQVVSFGSDGSTTLNFLHADGSFTPPNPSETYTLSPTGKVTMAPGAVLSTSGLLVNDSPVSNDPGTSPIMLNGGSISVAGYNVSLSSGALFDVSGGALIPASGRTIIYGKAGGITLSAGQDSLFPDIHNGLLTLGSTLRGYSGPGLSGGSLTLVSQPVRIGNFSQIVSLSLDGTDSAQAGLLDLSPAFFNQGGFSSFKLTAVGRGEGEGTVDYSQISSYLPGIAIDDGVIIHPMVSSQLINRGVMGIKLVPTLLPSPYAPAVSLSLTAKGLGDSSLSGGGGVTRIVRGLLTAGDGSLIRLDPQLIPTSTASGPSVQTGSLSLNASLMSELGSIIVPGGTVSLTSSTSFPWGDLTIPDAPHVTMVISPSSILSVAGTAIFGEDPLGIRNSYGSVLSGGSIQLVGNFIAPSGSLFDASGTSGKLDLLATQSSPIAGSGELSHQQVDSAGGTITLTGGEAMRSDATLHAYSGGPSAMGGLLTLSSGRFYGDGQSLAVSDPGLSLVATGRLLTDGIYPNGASALGVAMDAAPGIAGGGGGIAVTSFSKGGFDSLTLSGNVLFHGPDPISISMPGSIRVASGPVPNSGSLSADTRVTLQSSYMALGLSFAGPLGPNDTARNGVLDPGGTIFAPPTSGNGVLDVSAKLIDVGNLSLQGINSATFDAGQGVIRGDGSFVMAGDLTMKSSQIYPVTGVSFTTVAFGYDDSGAAVPTGGTPGSITLLSSAGAASPLPLSAGGSLSLYADSITQAGFIVAPFGSITLGAGLSGGPTDPMSGLSAPSTTTLNIKAGSITSVSGAGITVPFGTSPDGTVWNDPAGTPITTTGLTAKAIHLNAINLSTESDSTIDLSGGGAVTANQWVNGLGGHADLLSRADAYAILPGRQLTAAPTGYNEGGLSVGQQFVTEGVPGLPNISTLLPSGYATQPGADLLIPTSLRIASAFVALADGTYLVKGTMKNGLDSGVDVSALGVTYLLIPSSRLLYNTAQPNGGGFVDYKILSADSFFTSPSVVRTTPAQGGKLVVQGTSSLLLGGKVNGSAGNPSAAGASIDIASSGNIFLSADGTGSSEGFSALSADAINKWTYGSLLLGGERGTPVNGLTPLAVDATSITVDSSVSGDHALRGNDIILAANQSIVLGNGDTGVSILSSGTGVAPDEQIQIGTVSTELTRGISGDGVFLRVSSDSKVSLSRVNVDPLNVQSTGLIDANGNSYVPTLSVKGEGKLGGTAMILDSSASSIVSGNESLSASIVTLSAGSISLVLDPASQLSASDISSSLQLSGTVLNGLSEAATLNLRSASSIDFYGSGSFGNSLMNLSLHSRLVSGDNLSDISLSVANLSIDNSTGVTDPAQAELSSTGGSLNINGGRLTVGSGPVSLACFKTTLGTFSESVRGNGTVADPGALIVGGNLALITPFLTATGGSVTSLSTTGLLTTTPSGSLADNEELGASLALSGAQVDLGAPILLHSGSVSVTVTGVANNLTLSSTIDVSGIVKKFQNTTASSDAGSVSLSSLHGDVHLASGSVLQLSSAGSGASAGSLSVRAPEGSFSMADNPAKVDAQSGIGGTGGSLSVDVGTLPSLASIVDPLARAGFTTSQTFRVRGWGLEGDVAIDNANPIVAHTFSLTADQGTIDVAGVINASGYADKTHSTVAGDGTGGSISLFAGKSIILENGSLLDVSATKLNAAGRGGIIDLEAGNSTCAVVASSGRTDTTQSFDSSAGLSLLDIRSGSVMDLTVATGGGGVLRLIAPQTHDVNDLQINPVFGMIKGASSVEVYGANGIAVTDPSGMRGVAGNAAIDPIPLWGNLPTGLAYQPGQTVVGGDGNVYKLTTDASLYAQYVAGEYKSGQSAQDPSQDASYWSMTYQAWDSSGETTYSPGQKVYDAATGLIYKALQSVASAADPSVDSVNWTLAADEGNLKQLALNNAATFSQNAIASGTLLGNLFGNAKFGSVNAPHLHLRPSETIENTAGGLILNYDWNLSASRYGSTATVLDPSGNPTANSIGTEPGLLTLRASGNIGFQSSLSDGFGDSVNASTVSLIDPLLPLVQEGSANAMSQSSWSYRITAGADTSANPLAIHSSDLGGDILLGTPVASLPSTPQEIFVRTGAGGIVLSAARDITLHNPFVTVYSAGARVLDPTIKDPVTGVSTFDTPIPFLGDQGYVGLGNSTALGGTTGYVPQYSSGGGDVTLHAGRDIRRVTASPTKLLDGDGNPVIDANGNPVATYQYDGITGTLVTRGDSTPELPSNWLYRRGSVDSSSGMFQVMNILYQTPTVTIRGGDVASTTWWIDYSNFFQDVGALGGGNVTLNAGRDVVGVGAVIPTQARMSGVGIIQTTGGKSLGNIASDSGLSLTALVSANAYSALGSQIGSFSPQEGTPLSIPNQSTPYVVSAGDTLETIASQFSSSAVLIASRNSSILSGFVPQQGTAVRIPLNPSQATMVETGGGNLDVSAGRNIDAGVYYVEKGSGVLRAGGSVMTDQTRDPGFPSLAGGSPNDSHAWLPTTFFLGKGNLSVTADGNLLAGPVANVFLTPQGINNGYYYKNYFSTYDPSDHVTMTSLSGDVTMAVSDVLQNGGVPYSMLQNWYAGQVLGTPLVNSEPWLQTSDARVGQLGSLDPILSLIPSTLSLASYSGNVNLQGNFTLSPAPLGNLTVLASGNVNGLSIAGGGFVDENGVSVLQPIWMSATLNLSDANPGSIPGALSPISRRAFLDSNLQIVLTDGSTIAQTDYSGDNGSVTDFGYFTDGVSSLFQESGSYFGSHGLIQNKLALHGQVLQADGTTLAPLHTGDPNSMKVESLGSVSGFTLFSPKESFISARGDISDVSFYLQNLSPRDVSVVSAGGNLLTYDSSSDFRKNAAATAQILGDAGYFQSAYPGGDLQISGPGALEILAHGNIDLGNSPAFGSDPTVWVGITSIGNARNPNLTFQGADLVVMPGLDLPTGLASTDGSGKPSLPLQDFTDKILSSSDRAIYLKELNDQVTYSGLELSGSITADALASSSELSPEVRSELELRLFDIVLRDTGRNYNKVGSPGYKSYQSGEDAVKSLFGTLVVDHAANLITWSRNIRTKNGGDITMLAPDGEFSLASIDTGSALTPPGIITEHGGAVDIYTSGNVSLGIGRVFTLRGGDIMMWSDKGNIAAGASAKTVSSAPPTRVLVDPQSGNIQTDLAGLATGGGIGVLATVEGVPPGSVDLIAPSGIIDAGDAGIRSSGNLNLAAPKILNADNIAAVGVTAGAPAASAPVAAAPPSAPSVSAPAGASTAAAANNSAASDASKGNAKSQNDDTPSVFSIDILGYGGGEDDDDKKKAADNTAYPAQASL